VTGSVVLVNVSFGLKNVLPGVDSLVDREISEDGGWASGNA